jgi:hypothetical protein
MEYPVLSKNVKSQFYYFEDVIFMLIPLLIAWFMFMFLVKLLKITISHAFMIATIIFLLQVSYGITPQNILDFITEIPKNSSTISK